MLPGSDKPAAEVVQIDSSDEEDNLVVVTATNSKSSTTPPLKSRFRPAPQKPPEESHQATAVPPVVHDSHTLECRSFWKAGGYDVGLVSSKAPPQGKLEHARVHPKFLHSNATSHKWAFGAIAELLDNAVDEIQNGATFVKVDKIDIIKDNSPALVFQDDGGGMNPDSIRKCMSLGYSSKKSNTTIGQYGNGFKTSTMRLGADVIVFSRTTRGSQATQSVGLLSYTFLLKTGLDDVIVPMIDFDISGHWAEPIIYSSQDDWSSNLNMILEWSPFASRDELMEQFEMIGQHGTRIIIYNLWLNDEGIYELSFDDDDEDICLRDEANRDQPKIDKRKSQFRSHISYCLRYSLRAYASILYLRKFKNFTIILRGKPVQQFNVADDLRYSEKVAYKPQLASTSKEIVVDTTIGFIKEAPALTVCGFNIYHRNRLIRPFWKVIGEGSVKGNGVVGVLEANFLEPAHDKQDFERSSLFIRLETRLKQMVADYWKTHCHFVGYQPPNFRAQNMQKGPVAKTHDLPPTVQPNIGLRANLLEEVHLDQQVPGRPANSHQYMSERQFGRDDQISLPAEQQVAGFAAVSHVSTGVMFEGGSGPISVDQLCEENIQLYLRFEEQMQKEAELEQTVDKLEKELEQAKRKCDQLSNHLERKRKEMIGKQGGKIS